MHVTLYEVPEESQLSDSVWWLYDFTNLLCKRVKCLERIKSALQRKQSGILLSPATNLLSVRFHIIDKYLHSLII